VLGWVLQPGWGENFLLSEGVEQSGEEASFAFHPCAVIGIPDSRSFQQLLERGFQAMRLLRQCWIALASARMPGDSMPSSFVTRIFIIRTPSLVEEGDRTRITVNRNSLPADNPLRNVARAHHGRDAVFSGDN